jgi:hypothetical protein
VFGDRDVGHAIEAEVLRQGRSESGRRAAPVLGPDRVPDGLAAQKGAAAPVAGQPAERQVTGDLPVGPDRHAVDPGAAGQRRAPRGFAVIEAQARAQHRERVVDGDRGLRPALGAQRHRQGRLFLREVGARQAGQGMPRDQFAGLDSRLGGHLLHEAVEDQHRLLDAVLLLAGTRAAQ